MSLTQSSKGARQIGKCRSKVGTKNAVQPSYSTGNEQDRDNTWRRKMSLTQSSKGARPIGKGRSKVGTKMRSNLPIQPGTSKTRTTPGGKVCHYRGTPRAPTLLGIVNRRSAQRYGLTFLFNRKRTRLERHLVAKYVTNAEPHGRPPYWGLSIEGQHKDTVRPSYPTGSERGRDDTWWRNMSLTQSSKGTRPIGKYRSKVGTKNAVQPSYSTRNEQDRDNTWWRNMSLTQSPADARPIGDHQPKSKNIRC